jgi:predicted ATPase
VVDVIGEAGVGKSRLFYEFKKALDSESTFLTGVCAQYGQNVNYLPFIDIVKAAFGIEEDMAEGLSDRNLRESFLHAPPILEILSRASN